MTILNEQKNVGQLVSKTPILIDEFRKVRMEMCVLLSYRVMSDTRESRPGIFYEWVDESMVIQGGYK